MLASWKTCNSQFCASNNNPGTKHLSFLFSWMVRKNMVGWGAGTRLKCFLIPWLSDHLQLCPVVWLSLPFAGLSEVSLPLDVCLILSLTLLFSMQVKTVNTVHEPALYSANYTFYVMKHYSHSEHSEQDYLFFVRIALGCMVSLLHSNKKPVVWCRSKLDTVLEFSPLFS